MARGRSALSPLSSLSSPSSFLWQRNTPLLVLLLLHLPLGLAAGQTIHTLYWNSTSPIFHSDDPLLVNMEGHKFTFDQVGTTPSFHDSSQLQFTTDFVSSIRSSSRYPAPHFLVSHSPTSLILQLRVTRTTPATCTMNKEMQQSSFDGAYPRP